MRGYEQQSGDKISDAIKLGVPFHHLPDASFRERLLLELTSVWHVRSDGSRNTNSGHGENDLVRSDATASEHTREGCCLSCVREERTRCERLLVSNQQREWERQERQDRPRERAQNSRTVTSRRKVLATTAMRLVISPVNVRRRKSQTL